MSRVRRRGSILRNRGNRVLDWRIRRGGGRVFSSGIPTIRGGSIGCEWSFAISSLFSPYDRADLSPRLSSVARGACLPLTTDYLPSADALATQYSDYRYSIPTSNLTSSPLLRTDNPRRTPVLELITELISQRLSHGFQCVTPANHAG